MPCWTPCLLETLLAGGMTQGCSSLNGGNDSAVCLPQWPVWQCLWRIHAQRLLYSRTYSTSNPGSRPDLAVSFQTPPEGAHSPFYSRQRKKAASLSSQSSRWFLYLGSQALGLYAPWKVGQGGPYSLASSGAPSEGWLLPWRLLWGTVASLENRERAHGTRGLPIAREARNDLFDSAKIGITFRSPSRLRSSSSVPMRSDIRNGSPGPDPRSGMTCQATPGPR